MISVTLGTMIDRAIFELSGPAELGMRVVIGADALTNASDTQFTMNGTSANVSDLIEFGSELMLVTGKTADAVPVYTVARGYYGTTAASGFAAGTVGIVNPQWPRIRIAEAVRRSFGRLEALGVGQTRAASFNRTADKAYIQMPAETRDVHRVGYVSDDGFFHEIDRWRFFDDVPTSVIATGKIVRLPRYVRNTDDLEVTYSTPYRWSSHPATPTEAATMELPEGAEDLPSAYAVAWLLSAREISRADLDKAEEWNRGEPQRGGVSLTLARAAWQNFYRMVDEARRLEPTPISRPYIRMSKVF